MSTIELTATNIAFKEWGVICAALGSGKQTLILRKGGIHEGRTGFRVAHREFWLLPTQFHAAPEALVPEAQALFPEVTVRPGEFAIRQFAVVEEVLELHREEQALALQGLHLWSEETVKARFAYKQPGLFLLVTRIHQTQRELRVLETPHMAGCKSWVELPEAIDTLELTPVLSDDAFRHAVEAIHARLRQ